MPYDAIITKSKRLNKRFRVDLTNTETGEKTTVHFGSKNGKTYLDHIADGNPLADKIKENYLARHRNQKKKDGSPSQDWKDPTTAGYWSRWFLWSAKNIENLIKMFQYKGISISIS